MLLWAAINDPRLTTEARSLVSNNERHFSAASIWEVAIKTGLKRPDFRFDPGLLREGLLDNGYAELPVTGAHAAIVASLPPVHRDPFDRLLVAQAISEGLLLLTADSVVSKYPGPVRLI